MAVLVPDLRRGPVPLRRHGRLRAMRKSDTKKSFSLEQPRVALPCAVCPSSIFEGAATRSCRCLSALLVFIVCRSLTRLCLQPKGRFADKVESAECRPCAVAKFANIFGATECTAAPQGFYVGIEGMWSCVARSVGFGPSLTPVPDGLRAGSEGFVACPKGRYSKAVSSHFDSTRARGQFRSASCSFASCFHELQGASACTECEPGSQNSQEGQPNCRTFELPTDVSLLAGQKPAGSHTYLWQQRCVSPASGFAPAQFVVQAQSLTLLQRRAPALSSRRARGPQRALTARLARRPRPRWVSPASATNVSIVPILHRAAAFPTSSFRVVSHLLSPASCLRVRLLSDPDSIVGCVVI